MLGFADPEDISNDLDFTEMGMDSLRAVELVIQLHQNLGIDETLVLYDYPNVSVLANSLVDRIDLETPSMRMEAVYDKEKIINYSSNIEKDVLDFYLTEMSNAGWTLTNDESSSTLSFAALEFEKDGIKVSVNAIAQGDKVAVTITGE